MSVMQIMKRNSEKLHKNKEKFYSIFTRKLEDFFDLTTGFDLVRFDVVVVQAPVNKSIKAVLTEKYGIEAIKLINSLL